MQEASETIVGPMQPCYSSTHITVSQHSRAKIQTKHNYNVFDVGRTSWAFQTNNGTVMITTMIATTWASFRAPKYSLNSSLIKLMKKRPIEYVAKYNVKNIP